MNEFIILEWEGNELPDELSLELSDPSISFKEIRKKNFAGGIDTIQILLQITSTVSPVLFFAYNELKKRNNKLTVKIDGIEVQTSNIEDLKKLIEEVKKLKK